MGEHFDVNIEIYGEITDIAHVRSLAAEMDGHVSSEGFGEKYFADEYEAMLHILNCLKEGKKLDLYRTETAEGLYGISGVCRGIGLPYKVMYQPGAGDGHEMRTWAPSFEEELHPDCNSDFAPIIDVRTALRAIDHKNEKAIEAIRNAAEAGLIGVPQTLTASANLIAELEAALGLEETPAP